MKSQFTKSKTRFDTSDNNEFDGDHNGFEEDTMALTGGNYLQHMSPSKTEEAYIIVLSGNRMGAMVKVGHEITVGRSERADFQIPDEGVSRVHARLTKTPDGGVCIEDLNSRNGTFVNNIRVGPPHLLQDGDKIRIGTTTILKFSYQDQVEETFQLNMYNAALRDSLTQLHNRRYFSERLETEFSFSSRHRSPLCMVLFDVDHFKQVNDTYGHSTGDLVLVGLAKAVKRLVRMEDLFARYGGEEFALLCRGTNCETGFKIADRIRATIEQTNLVPSRPEVKVTVSAGVAATPDQGIDTSSVLIQAADKALYQAKRTGRNRVCIFVADTLP